MIQISNNHNIIFLALDSNLPNVKEGLRREVNELLTSTVNSIKSNEDLDSTINQALAQVFDFRFKALSYLAENSLVHELSNIDSIYIDFNRESLAPEKQVLVKNVLFALRTTNRVLSKLMKHKDFDITTLKEFNNVSYNQFLSIIAVTIPNQSLAQNILDFTHASLKIELILLISKNLIDGKYSMSNQSIEGLSKLISDATQDFYAYASKLGFLQKNNKNLTYLNLSDSESDVKDQKELADLGLNELVHLF